MKLESCIRIRKEKTQWDNLSNESIGALLSLSCDLTGKLCNTAKKFEEDHTIKFQKEIVQCTKRN